MIHSLASLRFTSPDVDAWRRYGEDVLGMTSVPRNRANTATLRMDEHPGRLVVEAGDSTAIAAIGFQVVDDRSLAHLADRLEAAGHPARTGTTEELASRQARGLLLTEDPFGVPLEFAYGLALDHCPLSRSHVSGFVTDGVGMGHIVLGGEQFDEALVFYQDTLGFVERNTMRVGMSKGSPSEDRLHFLGCNPRHHTVALMKRSGPPTLIHFMVEVEDIDDVGRVHDRSISRGMAQRLTFGRHTNDGMVSFYSQTPDGYTVEVGCEGRLVGPDTPTYEITRTSYWGHHRVEPGGEP